MKYQIVWITKYRKPFLQGEIAKRARDLVREICKAKDVEIIKGHISKEHVYLFVSVPPHISVGQLVQYLKGMSSRKLLLAHKGLSRALLGRHLWAHGYFVASSRNVTDEVVMKYVEQQGNEPIDGHFKVDEKL